jgi:HK97 family phage prohead protease
MNMAKQLKAHNQEQKSVIVPISDDGDEFKVGDLVSFDSWDTLASDGMPQTSGMAFLGIIRVISGTDATVEYLDTTMQPRGDTCVRPLSSLRQYILPAAPVEPTPEPTPEPAPADPAPSEETPAEEKSPRIQVIPGRPADNADGIEYKSVMGMTSSSVNGRTVDGIAAVMGNIDNADDITHKGAFNKTIREQGQRVMFTFNHEVGDFPTARIDELKEVPRDELPHEIKSRYPEATGGLFVRRTYLDTDRGNQAFVGVTSGAIKEMSYGYKAVRRDFTRFEAKTVRNLREVRLVDVCDTTLGINPATMSKKGALPYKSAPKAAEDAPWNGAAEIRRADVIEMKAISAWGDPEHRENKSGYHFVHHRADDGHTVVWAGVKSAMAELLSGNIDLHSADRRATFDHLSRHFEDFGKEPPDVKLLEIAYSVKDARNLIAQGVDFKAGRMISAANEAKIRTVMDGLAAQLETLNELLGIAEPPAEETTEEVTEETVDAKALTSTSAMLALLELARLELETK